MYIFVTAVIDFWCYIKMCVLLSACETMNFSRKSLYYAGKCLFLSGVKPFLFVCLFLKVVYFAATFPYAILFVLLVTGLLQNGSLDGVLYFITPTWEKLLDIQVGTNTSKWLRFVAGPSISDTVQQVATSTALPVGRLSSTLFT